MLSKDTRQGILVLTLVLASLYLNLSLIEVVRQVKHVRKQQHVGEVRPENSYSYTGKDQPVRLPIERKQVKMTIEESTRYSIMDPEAEMEWLWTGPVGDHAVRLGEGRRGYVVAMFHELHCLRLMRKALESGRWSHMGKGAQGHMHHCFVYLRQWTLCSADVTLEPGDFTKRNLTLERTGATHTCYDWFPVYDRVTAGWEDWEEYRISLGVPDRTLG
ncbi:hypothetical protein BC835DRAFT_1519209 [Cytidiella melzeri]|nr:hypothetical protein BC835DRAFT_1519209 [Cytidiella melzeri]